MDKNNMRRRRIPYNNGYAALGGSEIFYTDLTKSGGALVVSGIMYGKGAAFAERR